MKLNNRFLFGILSLLLSAIIAFIAIPTIAGQTNGKTEIIRVTSPIAKGEEITPEAVEVMEVGSYNLPDNVARSMQDVAGRYAAADFEAGDYILASKVSLIPITSDVALNNIPSGKVAISLTVKTLASGLSDKLQPGDIIRIYHYLDAAREVPELRYVQVLSVTDSDGNNVDKCQLAAAQFRNALHLFPAPESGWTPQVLTYSGFYGLGIKEIWDMVYQYIDFVRANGYFEHRRNEQAKFWMYETINEHLRNSFYQNETIAQMLAAEERQVLEGRQTSFVAAKQLLDAYFALLH